MNAEAAKCDNSRNTLIDWSAQTKASLLEHLPACSHGQASMPLPVLQHLLWRSCGHGMLELKCYLGQSPNQRRGSLDILHILTARHNASVSCLPVQSLHT